MSKSRFPNPANGLRGKNREQVLAACKLARQHLSKISRRTGESYAVHGMEVAAVLREVTDDASLLSVAVLHDLLVHPDGREFLSSAPLTQEGRALVERMYELRRLNIDTDLHDLDIAISAFTEDPRLLPLRMAHRLNDVRSLHRFTPQLRRTIAKETLHMYSSLAARLGMHAWRYEMEDVCFIYMQPKMAKQLQKRFALHSKLDEMCLKQMTHFLQRELRKAKILARIEQRIKGLHSTYRKMVLKRRKFEELTDRLAIRIIVPQKDDCYRVLGVVHERMHPVPGKLKDYIGAPKENGYRSIHTVVYPLPGVTEQPIEVQIRSEHMHKECEFGAAHHGQYKNLAYALRTNSSRVNLFRNLQSLRADARSPKQFEEALRTYFREDHLAIFDEKNNLYHLRKPATALDFVCHVFPKRVQFLKSIKINGRLRPVDADLSDGDTVEPAFSRRANMQKDWLNAVRHQESKRVLKNEG